MKKVLILGAGFGGLELATRLCELVPNDVEVTLVDQKDHFYVGFSKIDVLFGRRSANAVKRHYKDIAASAVKFRQERILSIDPANRSATTTGGTYNADILVVALGADVDPAATPGFVESGGHEFYTLEGAEKAAPVLAGFRKGRVLLSILGAPYKCPPAPYEVALQLHDHFGRLGVRNDVSVQIVTPAPMPLTVSKDGSAKLLELMAERNVAFSASTLVTSVDAAARVATTKTGEKLPFDLFLGVPVHKVPAVVSDCGLAPKGGWVSVKPHTLETTFPGVYAIGDVTTIPVGQAAMPKSGAFADRAARAVADDIVQGIKGSGPRGNFDGAGSCYLEFGEGRVAKVDANFLGGPEPRVAFLGPSSEYMPEKEKFASDRIGRWFKA